MQGQQLKLGAKIELVVPPAISLNVEAVLNGLGVQAGRELLPCVVGVGNPRDTNEFIQEAPCDKRSSAAGLPSVLLLDMPN